MVCSTAILSSTLALSLLQHSSPPSQSFVLSPFSLNTALSIIHDGANGTTQKELTNLLLDGCSPSDVTDFYSSLAYSVSRGHGVSFKSANRFYVDDSISLKEDYEKHIKRKYQVEVQNLNLTLKDEAANEMNKFVEEATNGKIKNIVNKDGIDDDAKAFIINAIYFVGNWKFPFNPKATRGETFHGDEGERKIDFMRLREHLFRVNQDNDFGTVLLLPYEDEKYNFFYLMPKENSNVQEMRRELTGERLIEVLKDAKERNIEITVPNFKIESELDGVEVLSKLGARTVFTEEADLSKISTARLCVSKIQHNAVIEFNELGTAAAAATAMEVVLLSDRAPPPSICIDRPFLFGILRNDDILFIGQFV